LQEICKFHGGFPGTIATDLARIASTVKPSEYNDFLKSVKKAAARHARTEPKTAGDGVGSATS